MPKAKPATIAALSLLGFTIFSGAILASSTVSADDVVDQINITVPVSCTMSGTGMTSHNAEINNGQYNSAIGETTLKAFCNDNEGFAIYAVGYTNSEEGNNVLTNSTLGSTYDIATGTATSGNNSNWAMKLSTISSPSPTYPIIIAGTSADTLKEQGDPDFTTFQAVPDDYAKVAYRTAGTDIGTNAEGSTLKTTYQAYISSIQPAGTYTGQVKYTLVHPHDATAPQIPIYMQDLTSTSIAALLPNTHSTATVYDKRDNQAYTIAKLADGKYWMAENLNIAGGTALSYEDTDFDSTYTLPTTGNWTVSDDKLILPASSTSGFDTDNYAYVYNSGIKENCGSYPSSGSYLECSSYYSWDAATLGSGRNITTNNNDADYSICPKNWKLPTARYSDPFESSIAAESDFYNLATSYGMSMGVWSQVTSNFYNQAGFGTTPNFLLAGYCFSGFNNICSYVNTYGYYWSSTSSNSTKAQSLGFIVNYNIETAMNSNRKLGYAVRCLFAGQ